MLSSERHIMYLNLFVRILCKDHIFAGSIAAALK